MPIQPPSLNQQIADLTRRVEELERNRPRGRDTLYHEVPFTFAGPLIVSQSMPWHCRVPMILTTAAVSLRVPGTSDTTVEVRRNGAVLPGGTLTIGSGDTLASGTAYKWYSIGNVPLRSGDAITCAIASVGNGAQDLDVQVRFG